MDTINNAGFAWGGGGYLCCLNFRLREFLGFCVGCGLGFVRGLRLDDMRLAGD